MTVQLDNGNEKVALQPILAFATSSGLWSKGKLKTTSTVVFSLSDGFSLQSSCWSQLWLLNKDYLYLFSKTTNFSGFQGEDRTSGNHELVKWHNNITRYSQEVMFININVWKKWWEIALWHKGKCRLKEAAFPVSKEEWPWKMVLRNQRPTPSNLKRLIPSDRTQNLMESLPALI